MDEVTFGYLDENFTSLQFENATVLSSEPIQLLLYDIFIPLLGVFIIALNLFVVISSGIILKKGQQPRSTYLFLGNVALSDLVTGIAVLFGQYYPQEHINEYSCAIQIGLIVSSTLASVYSVGLIGLDRFLYIIYGLQYQHYIYPSRAGCLILVTWILGLVIGFLPAMGWRGDTDAGRTCWFIILAPPSLVLLTTIVGLLPILLVVVLYSIILYTAIRKVNQLQKASGRHGVQTGSMRVFTGRPKPSTTGEAASASDNETQDEATEDGKSFLRIFRRRRKTTTARNSKTPTKWKAIKIVLFTTASFVFTWIPFFVVSTWYVFCDNDTTPDLCTSLRLAIAGPLAVLGFANSLINPFIYAWWHNGFRKSIAGRWNRCCKCCRNRVEPAADVSPLASATTRCTNISSSSDVLNQNVLQSTS